MRIPFKLAIISAAIALAACSTTPTSTTLLDQTRLDYQAAINNPDVNKYASTELTQSAEAIDKANAAAAAHDKSEKIDELAYAAKQKISITVDVAKQKAAEAVVASSEKRRTQIQLNQRTNEVNIANSNTEKANNNAEVASEMATIAQSDAQLAQARADKFEQELKDLHAQKTDHGIVISFGDILFNTDKFNLTPSGVALAQKVAVILNENPQRTVSVCGFTDSTGTAAYNLGLSERRANSVSDILLSAGVAHQRVTVQGFGETRPVADNNTAENRQMNRRVEITLSDANGNMVSAK